MMYQFYENFKTIKMAEKVAHQLRNEGYKVTVKRIKGYGYGVYIGGFRKIAPSRRKNA